jgi:hypothetical protein
LLSFDVDTAGRRFNDVLIAGANLVSDFGLYLYLLAIAVPGIIGSIFPGPGTAAGIALGQMLSTVIGGALAAVGAATSGVAAFFGVEDIGKIVSDFLKNPPEDFDPDRDEVYVALPAEKQQEVAKNTVSIAVSAI